MIEKIREKVKETRPLIHCITNPISIHQCANAVLAVGARPIMAEHPDEVEEITATAKALMLNLGNITDVRMEAMLRASSAAKKYEIPVLLDAVGVACSRMRRNFAEELLSKAPVTVVKGNYSEIQALCSQGYVASGIDAEASLTAEQIGAAADKLAGKYRLIVLASGKTDIITDGKQRICVKNGSPMLTAVTGTGCMLGALCASYLSAGEGLYGAAAACGVLGVCGELAETRKGSGSFMVSLMDRLSTLSRKELERNLKMEVIEIAGI